LPASGAGRAVIPRRSEVVLPGPVEDYREAAARCARLGEGVARLAALVRGWRVDAHIAPGPVAAAVVEQLALTAADLQIAAAEMADIGRECWQRAVQSDRRPR